MKADAYLLLLEVGFCGIVVDVVPIIALVSMLFWYGLA